jgi:hypothetical protein
MRHEYAAVLAVAGRRSEAEQVLAPDFSPAQIDEFLSTVRDCDAAPVDSPLSSPARLAAQGGVQVQLAVSPTNDAAQAEWQRLQENATRMLAGHAPIVIRNQRIGHLFWESLIGNFVHAAVAQGFGNLSRKANGVGMVIARCGSAREAEGRSSARAWRHEYRQAVAPPV